MKVIRMADIGVSSGRSSSGLNSFGSGFVMDDGEWLEDHDEEVEELVEAVCLPVVARAARLLAGTKC